MAKFNYTIRVEAPIEATWEAFANLEKAEQRIDAITKLEILTDGPVGEGTRWAETRMMFKKEHTEEMWITAWNPMSGYTVRCDSCGMIYESEFRLTPVGAATEVEFEMRARPVTFMAKLMSPIGRLMLGPMMRKYVGADFTQLKAVAESGDATPAGAEQALA